MSKRERYILVVTFSVIAIFALDYFVFTPLSEAREQLTLQKEKLVKEASDAQKTISASRKADQRWRDYRAAGLSSDASATESALMAALRSWSQESNLPLLSIRPERVAASQGIHEITFQVTADGSMRAISRFLYRLETSQVPVRVHELQLSSRNEGSDNLSMQLRLSTLWDETRSPAKNPVPTKEGQR